MAHVEHVVADMQALRTDMREWRTDMRQLRNTVDQHLYVVLGAMIGLVTGPASLMARGFHWF